jgi:adenosylcobinamide-GDP ribazoletransferase
MPRFAKLAPYGAKIRSGLAARIRLFLLALGFLTRLAPALRADGSDMGKAAFHYPSAGIVLGAVLALACDLFPGQPLIRAWGYAVLSLWLTRALHLDGLADVLDALGSGKHGEEFRQTLKDSRTGAFGAAGITAFLAGQIILAAAILESGRIAPLFFAPVYGRCLPILFTTLAPAHPEAGLGAILAAAPRKAAAAFELFCALGGGLFCLSPSGLFLCLALTAPCLLALARTARREGGYNGDFLGAAILAGEICALLAAVMSY